MSEDTVEYFRLGYVKEPALGDEMHRGRLAIPYLTSTGVVTIRYRSLDGRDPKYLSSAGDSVRPYNTRDMGNRVFLTEGELDCMTMWQMGYSAVGIPGVKSWKSVYRRIFRFRTVYLMADGDTAGLSLIDTIRKDIPGLIAISMPDGEDVNSMYNRSGADYFKEVIGE